MKLVLIFMMFTLIGCTITPEGKEHFQAAPFEDKKNVILEMKAFNPNDVMDDGPLSKEEKLRQGNLIDQNVFFSKISRPLMESNFMVKSGIEDLPEEVDLRFRDTSVKSQDNGKCTSFGGVAGMESTINRSGRVKGLNLSEWHSWSYYRQYSADAFVYALTKNKISDEKYYPQYKKASRVIKSKSHAMITNLEYLGQSTDKMARALSEGNVVYLAMTTPKDMLRCKSFISPYSSPDNGGHAILIVGYYKDAKVAGGIIAIIKNSWGSDCGDQGYQYLPLAHLCKRYEDYFCDMWAIKEVVSKYDEKPSPTPDPIPEPKPRYKRICKKRWYWPFKKKCYWKRIKG